ncbi:universal stress protein [Roseovarius amoyensis]|uniref:universal stress protein n=1 Tax=Roseovarius amoyensis TaxID=2211448 RepID=UPI000DBE7D11|nr:universal stress protein [Roseovarius amoyensis]
MANALAAGKYQHVMQTTDLSDGSRDALRRVSDLRIGENARNTLLHVFDAPALQLVMSHTMAREDRQNYLAEEQKEALRHLTEFIVKAKIGNVVPMVRHRATTAHHEIMKAAEEEKADLIVLSTHGRTGLAKQLIGSVTEKVLRSSSIDVLAVPPIRGE